MVSLIQTASAGLKKVDKEPIAFGFLKKVFISYSNSSKNSNIWPVLFTKLIHAYYSIHQAQAVWQFLCSIH